MSIFQHKKTLFTAVILLLLVLIGIPGMIKARYSNDISRLFPDGSESAKTFKVINQAHLADTFQLEFIAPEGEIGKYREYLLATAEKLRGDERIKQLYFEFPDAQINELLTAMPELSMRYFPAEKLAECDVEKSVSNAMMNLSTPAPSVHLRYLPLGLERDVLSLLENLRRATGLASSDGYGFIADKTRSRALMVFEADIPLGETAAAVKLLEDVDKMLSPRPAGLSYRVHSGTMHSIGNEKVLKRDSTIAGIVSVTGFVLLLALFGRRRHDIRALWILLIPLASSLLAFSVVSWVFPEVFLFVIGLGSSVAGLVVDQGIHVYIACRSREPRERLRALVKPMVIATASSCAVFVLLAFTDIAAYIQLAAFASLSLFFSTVISLVILPELLQFHPQEQPQVPAGKQHAWHKIAAVLLLAVITAGGVWGIKNLRFDLSMTALDGTPQEILAQEKEFRDHWMTEKRSPAILAVTADNEEQALQKLEDYSARLKAYGIEAVLPPMPSESKSAQTLATYRTPEAQKKIAGLKAACREKRMDKFYAPVFAAWEAPGERQFTYPQMLQDIRQRMVKTRSGKAVALAMMPDDPAQTENICNLTAGDSGTALLSPHAFKFLVKKELGGKFMMLVPWGGLLAVLLVLSVRGKTAVLALLPVVMAMLCLSAVFAVFQIAVTPAVLFTMLLLTGLAVDYGVYAVHQLRSQDRSLRDAMLLSALTTVIGAGSLAFSTHPALSGTGLVLAVGIAAAGLTGIYILPALAEIKCSGKMLLCLLTAGFLCGCQSVEPKQTVKMRPLIPQARQYTMLAHGTLGDGNDSIPVIVAAKVDSTKREIAVVLLNNAGIKLCTVSNVDGAEFELFCPPVCRKTAKLFAGDLAEIAFSGRTPDGAENFTAGTDGSSLSYSAQHWWYGTRKINLENIVYKVEKLR